MASFTFMPASTLLMLIAQLRKQAEMPPFISVAVLKSLIEQSGTVRKQIQESLRDLHLIDREGVPTEQFRRLVDAFDTPRWPDIAKEFLESLAPGVVSEDGRSLDLTCVREKFHMQGDVASEKAERSALRFFKTFAVRTKISLKPDAHSAASSSMLIGIEPSGGTKICSNKNVLELIYEEGESFFVVKISLKSLARASMKQKDAFFTIVDVAAGE